MIPRVPLCTLPTPLHPLPRVGEALGLDLWIKRDDLTGFAGGGNKGRKLEYLMADVLQSGKQTVVTCGALQSNFIRQLGAACSRFGIRVLAVAMETPFDAPAGRPPKPAMLRDNGNALLDRLLDVELETLPDGDWETLFAIYAQRVEDVDGYGIPVGGSSPLGAYAFHQAADELCGQTEVPFDWIVTASSSGSTQTGLAYAFEATSTRVLGICSDPEPEIAQDFAELGKGLAEILGVPQITADRFLVDGEHVGPGYGVPSSDGWEAIGLLAREEGIFLDPIYSAKAFAGLIDLAHQGMVSGRVLFWHTGGFPALFAYPPID